MILAQIHQQLQLRANVFLGVGGVGGDKGGIEVEPDVVYPKAGDWHQAELGCIELIRSGGANQKLERIGGCVLARDPAIAAAVNRAAGIISQGAAAPLTTVNLLQFGLRLRTAIAIDRQIVIALKLFHRGFESVIVRSTDFSRVIA